MKDYQYGRYIAGVYRSFQQFLKVRLVEIDLRPLEFRVLLYLIRHDGANQEEIADWLCVDKSVVARMVKRMIEHQYLTRKVNEQDRRAYQLFRTEKAVAYEPEMIGILEEWEAIILEKVPTDEREHFSELMRGVFEHTRLTVRKFRQEEKMEQQTNKMGTMPIPKLLFSMALPAIVAMMVQALYNVVDSIFVSRLGEEALTAISLAFPIQLIIIAFFVGLGIGINSLVSRKLGENRREEATNAAEHGFMIAGILYVIIAILAFIIPKRFFASFTDNALVVEYGVQYITIVMLFAFGRIFAQAGISTMQGTGEMVKPMKAMMIGAVSNMILDPILIFGWFGLPALGIRGAAIATVTAQFLTMLYVFHAIFRQKVSLKLNLKSFHYDTKIVRQIVVVGLPAAIMQALGSVMLTGLNLILASFTDSAVAVLGVYFKLQSFIFMPIFGLSQGTLPIVGFNFGAKNRARMMEALRVAVLSAVIFMALGTVVFQLFPETLLKLFNSSPAMMEIGVHAFTTISWIFPMAGLSIILSTAFQAMGKAHLSMVVSFIRQLVVLLPAAYLLGRFFGLDAVWLSFVLSEIVGLSTVLIMFRWVTRTQLGDWSEVQEVGEMEVYKKTNSQNL